VTGNEGERDQTGVDGRERGSYCSVRVEGKEKYERNGEKKGAKANEIGGGRENTSNAHPPSRPDPLTLSTTRLQPLQPPPLRQATPPSSRFSLSLSTATSSIPPLVAPTPHAGTQTPSQDDQNNYGYRTDHQT